MITLKLGNKNISAKLGTITVQPKRIYDHEVEWIESDGASWIDTGIIASFNSNTKIRADFIGKTDVSPTGRRTLSFFGANSVYNGGVVVTTDTTNGQNQMRMNYGSYFILPDIKYSNTKRYVVEIEKNKGTINGTTYTYTSSNVGFIDSPIYIFALNRNGTVDDTTRTYARFFSFKIWQLDILVRDFIPVRSNNEGCLYDKISNTLFHNAGSGKFLIGPDKV